MSVLLLKIVCFIFCIDKRCVLQVKYYSRIPACISSSFPAFRNRGKRNWRHYLYRPGVLPRVYQIRRKKRKNKNQKKKKKGIHSITPYLVYFKKVGQKKIKKAIFSGTAEYVPRRVPESTRYFPIPRTPPSMSLGLSQATTSRCGSGLYFCWLLGAYPLSTSTLQCS